MSRSRRKNPIRGMTSSDSEKKDKQFAHRRIRRTIRQCLVLNPHVDVLPDERGLSNPWLMDKDGKSRFDPVKDSKEMRK